MPINAEIPLVADMATHAKYASSRSDDDDEYKGSLSSESWLHLQR